MTLPGQAKPKNPPTETCDWGNCDNPADHWEWAPTLSLWLPCCSEHDPEPDYQTPTLDPPAPEHGSPEWHIDQAVEHLAKADQLAGSGSPQGAMVRALAATANAQIAAAKLAISCDELLRETLGQLRDLNRRAEYGPDVRQP